MKAIVWHNIGDIRLARVSEPKIPTPTDAIVKLTASAICGTDLHMVRGTRTGMKKGTILGSEGVGIGDRVLVPSTIACGYCSYCRDGYYAQCDYANPNEPATDTTFFGGTESRWSLPRTTG